jgi:magnesium-transporting ATPase (P-type)
MTTLLNEQIETGDVIEITRGDDVISALVLLAADEAVILDACDGSTPFVVKRDELVEYRKFNPAI